ncbi:hypothetical protein Aglo03_23210 [Actinokineospora globicatena]|uniref:Uncharacterized protein n=1 Tax=Actinokineospora globicatena TaxID=103729 RepID=A0A9W6V6F2_9PSEU|nr:hypothetical protein Aglo03_23210 [Actinokineospora globicatena]
MRSTNCSRALESGRPPSRGSRDALRQFSTVPAGAHDEPVDTSHVSNHFSGFGYGLSDGGLTRADCAYAARTAGIVAGYEGDGRQVSTTNLKGPTIPVGISPLR